MHFINEQDGGASILVTIQLRALHRFANVLNAGKHGGDRNEIGVERLRHQPSQRGFADAGRAPQDHGMRFPRFERGA